MTGGVEETLWSNALDDIITLILSHLCYVDHIRFRAVCKNWRRVASGNGVKYADKLPWLLAYDSSSCFLYDLTHNREYIVCRRESFADAEVIDSKYGWVLFYNKANSSVFFFNPFINNIIQLPNLPVFYPRLSCPCPKATFSTTPDSADCMVFIFNSIYPDNFCINIFKTGEGKWRVFKYDGDYGNFIQDVEFLDGVLYWSFNSNHTGVFNVATKEWKVKEWNVLPRPPSEGLGGYNYLINCEGELLMTLCICDFSQQHHCRWYVLRCDLSELNWFRIESLENRSLFLSRCASMCIPVASEIENRINLILRNKSAYLQRRYEPGRSCRHKNAEIYKTYEWDIGKMKKLWIQPPQPR